MAIISGAGGRFLPGIVIQTDDDEKEYGEPYVASKSGQDTFTPKNWSTIDKGGWYEVSRASKDLYGFTSNTQFQSKADAAARAFRDKNGRYPSSSELMDDPRFQTYMGVAASGFNQLPPVFAVDGQTYYNDPLTGPRARGDKNNQDINTRLGAGGIDAMLQEGVLNNAGGWVTPKNDFTGEQFQAIMQSLAPARGGGSSGGGGGQQDIKFDREKLIEQYTDRHKGLMFEDPDRANVEARVDAYIGSATSFWRDGGSLDFDTFIVNKMRETSRYKTLYKRLGEHQTEEEYMAQYRGTVEQFGLNKQATQRETEAGLKSGAGLSGFRDRVSRTREARNTDGGAFSNKLAGTMAGLGQMG